MELSAPLMGLLASLGVPIVWLVPITALALLLVQKYFPNLKLPLPSVPDKPAPVTPSPLLPVLSPHPVLDLLLKLFALKSAGAFQEDHHALAAMLLKDNAGLKNVIEVKP